ncbi:hypothetical protein IWW34DRAFT_780656 [Fusarium oxysporum f. sp. albedinis]|uniref:uncharacterized protein n=1 Tax=Fusarium oxysporum Fo47 TaxID=660027 RepID=UPI002869DADF|nr:uncharacterized protein FOBCDRAFT_197428 [Fusarium oxysporum Fo47]KAI3588651.1 hypothetical protein IWW34DRAFT_780656 [Fusarium oxysporum f. sp. albedinis]WJG34786.1 hypothetical protein FOBCDRAFT_197428 [Fusarium oxysporum Fo47]
MENLIGSTYTKSRLANGVFKSGAVYQRSLRLKFDDRPGVMCGFIQQISARDARTASSKHPSGQGTTEVPLRRPRVPRKGELAHASSFDAGAKRRRGLAVLYCLVGGSMLLAVKNWSILQRLVMKTNTEAQPSVASGQDVSQIACTSVTPRDQTRGPVPIDLESYLGD